MRRKALPIRLAEIESAFKADAFPVAAANPEDWRPFLSVFTPMKTGDHWLGYEVAEMSNAAIKHAVYFMGHRSDTKIGYFITLELTGEKGSFKLSLHDVSAHSRSLGKIKEIVPPEKARIDVRATSQEFLDLIFIMAKSSI